MKPEPAACQRLMRINAEKRSPIPAMREGVQNPRLFRQNTRMRFGDGADSVEQILQQL
ncbi:hypothetical protein [Endozoicomonas sp. ONNA2]|uniref:hypothetical protein n=1 Tax=Endozoicomonas sp. ONNA2 TaxID=2828741 RepID=UPI0021472D0E|nr:hypothetical protein [Endozoicomonas sp. ONNA2]